MIKAEKLSYSFPQKDLYNKISFTLEDDVHCAFIGTNGTGKSTLVDMILHPDNYLYDGRLIVDVPGRIGYVSQFYSLDEEKEVTVFDYLSEEFVRLQNEINTICDEMATADELDELMERYQNVMDQFQAIDGDFYESNIRKQLKIANLKDYENHLLTNLSGGEFKLIQVIREMMISPKFIIMDEPDVFLDFEHLNALKNLINSHKGTLLVITHNRYLLNHCFNKILHLENAELQEFDGTYVDYNFALLEMKIEQQELAAADMEEIERNRKIVERLRNEATKVDSATKGRSLKARVSLLERLEARKTKSPFVDIKQPQRDLYIEKSADNFDGLDFLAGQDMSVVNRKAMEGTILAHTDGGVPLGLIEVDSLSAHDVGELIYFFWRACAVSGYLLSVNPFDQPGVESYKKNMFALLGKPGYEDRKAELEAALKD